MPGFARMPYEYLARAASDTTSSLRGDGQSGAPSDQVAVPSKKSEGTISSNSTIKVISMNPESGK